ncbi:hypothetical protein [Chryseolinea lacunae]|uniref:Secretin/TonB short N-terminal domain-containing protein n=1 Tax=Chryseolinea lacunae TaxID=2801331 RepID=A0ABS1L290_9BACT|nr:hypothetical protein [Chryseolinea lacunae]MBL0745814.1 hypothetical protein [Chryseolinea lacunae]
MRILSLATLLSCTLYANAQIDVSRRLTFKAENVDLPTLFDLLEKQCGITVIYGTDNLPAVLRVSITGNEISLLAVVNEICRQANLNYYIIESAIVFKYSQPKISNRPNDVTKQTVDFSPTIPPVNLPENKTLQATQIIISGDTLYTRPTVPTQTEPADDTIETKTMEAHSQALQGSERLKPKMTKKSGGIFLTYGIQRSIASETYSIGSHPSFSLPVTNRIFLRLSAGYASKDFTLYYNYKILDPMTLSQSLKQQRLKRGIWRFH